MNEVKHYPMILGLEALRTACEAGKRLGRDTRMTVYPRGGYALLHFQTPTGRFSKACLAAVLDIEEGAGQLDAPPTAISILAREALDALKQVKEQRYAKVELFETVSGPALAGSLGGRLRREDAIQFEQLHSQFFRNVPTQTELEKPGAGYSLADFAQAAEGINRFRAGDDHRPVLNGVWLRTLDDELVMAAADGYRLAEARLRSNVYHEVDGGHQEVSKRKIDAVVEGRDWAALTMLLSRMKNKLHNGRMYPEQNGFIVVEWNSEFGYKGVHFRFYLRVPDGYTSFPDYQSVVEAILREPTEGVEAACDPASHVVQGDFMADACKGQESVTIIHPRIAGGALKVEGNVFSAWLMPMSRNAARNGR